MIDKQGRIKISNELLEKSKNVKKGEKVKIFFEPNKRVLHLNSTEDQNNYFIATHKIDENGRFSIPSSIRATFPNAAYLPAERNGEIYILIIE